MAFIQYLVFDGMPLPLPDSYEVQMVDIEADSGGETEAGTTPAGCGTAGGGAYFGLLFRIGKMVTAAYGV